VVTKLRLTNPWQITRQPSRSSHFSSPIAPLSYRPTEDYPRVESLQTRRISGIDC